MCLGILYYISLYALSLHSTLAHLWVPFLHMLGRIRELELCNVKTQTITTYNLNSCYWANV